MKTQYYLLMLIALITASCSSSRDFIASDKTNFGNTSKLEVSSVMPDLKHPEATTKITEPHPAGEPQTNNNTAASTKGDVDSELNFNNDAMMPVEDGEQAMSVEELKTKMAEELHLVASNSDNKFISRIFDKTAKKMVLNNFQAKENLTFFDKAKAKLFAKIQSKFGINSRMAGGDILAIVSLVTGLLSWVAFHGSFVLGLVAIITGVIALKKGTSRRGMAIVGIIFGVLAMLFWSGWLFIF